MLRKNDTAEILIEDVTAEGNGVGRLDGAVIFVPAAAVGDRIRVRIVKVTPRFLYGVAEEILEPSPDRRPPDCPAFPRCGGCGLRHITYEAECRLKEGWVREAMRRIGGISLPPEPIIPSPEEEGWRNKAIYPVALQGGEVRIGFYARRSHRIAGTTDCRLHPPVFAALAQAFRDWLIREKISVYDENAHRGLVRALFLRRGEKTGQVMAAVIANGRRLPAAETLTARLREACPELVSLILNVNREKTNVLLGKECLTLWGADCVEDELCGLRFSLSPLSFYQVNRSGAERLYGAAAEMAELTGEETLLDLYCGAGTVGLSMARRVKRLIGVEIVPEAVKNAERSARDNDIRNARFLCGDAAAAALALESEGLRPDVIVADPPRKGLSPELISAMVRMAPDRVVYISCNPSTAARDLKLFAEQGYAVRRIRPVDMFPRTCHVETVCLLYRQKKDFIYVPYEPKNADYLKQLK